ncbi:MAG: ATP-dependent RNA helicase [Elusimicrobia bacterium]|nr:ATP-dependent RNA helicase [Elusimicrobiota bacterium]
MQKRTVNGKALGLPFWEVANDVVALARAGRGIIVMPTGTGKTTQAPQALAEGGFVRQGEIWISVPKRPLAAELAARVAQEMDTELGGLVGYQMRGERKISSATRVLFMTEGILQAKILRNPSLNGVTCVLLDEFHQRSLMGDFNAALIERAQNEGSKVAMLLMSATIDPSYLARHFNCGVVDGSHLAMLHPIAEKYVGDVGLRNGEAFEAAANAVIEMVVGSKQGNGLVFMPGKWEIDQTIDAIRKRLGQSKLDGVTILPLHGQLDAEDRHAPFAERSGTTVTVATDIVETGATLPDIGWVVDSGLAKEIFYDPLSDTSGLRVVEIAQDRLWQRRGRCGRVREGTYVGLFSEENALNRPERTQPEIYRRPLRDVVLGIKSLGLSRVGNPLSLIDSPPKTNWKQAKSQLQLLGLVAETSEAEITQSGRQAVKLGCDPRDAAMLLKAAELGCVREMAVAIAARQSTRRLLYVLSDERHAATESHRRFRVGNDLCDAWTVAQVVRQAEARGEQALGTWCRERYVSYRALVEIMTTARELERSVRSLGYHGNDSGTEEALAKAISAGLPDRVFEWTGFRSDYRQSGSYDSFVLGRESVISPSGKSIVAWEVIEIPTRGGRTMKLIVNAAIHST